MNRLYAVEGAPMGTGAKADHRIAGTAFPPKPPPALRQGWAEQPESAPLRGPDELEIVFRPDPTVYDGRFANNGWLQELPKPITKLTWGNAALVSPATARKYGLGQAPGSSGGEHGQAVVDMIELSYRGRTVKAPVWVAPGLADDSVTVHLGYGRTRAGSVGSGTGFNA